MKKHSFSVVIPAHNEEKYVARCINSVKAAAKKYGGDTEIIVVCNRCTDKTSEIAAKCGARVLFNEERCVAAVRNTGIFAAKGDIIVTIDCDNRMTSGTLEEIAKLLSTKKYIGGGAPIHFERYSFPLRLNSLLCNIGFRLTGLYCGMIWAEKRTLISLGGFSEIKAMEDVQTAKKLKRYGKLYGKQYTTLRNIMFKNMDALIKAALGDKRKLDSLLDDMFYDYNDKR